MEEISAALAHYPADCHPTQIEPLGNHGGMSGANFWRITAPRGTLILRRWPPEHPSPDRLQFIHNVIRHAARKVDFLPVPIQTRDGQSFVNAAGHLWELSPWMPGTADYERKPSDERLQAAMTALAKFHNAAADFQPSPETAATICATSQSAIPRRLERLHSLKRGEADQLASAIDDHLWPKFAQVARRFLAALSRALPQTIAHLEPLRNTQLPLQPCIRDIWHDHVLFTDNKVTGIVDFGAMDIDTPTTDIARLLGSLAGEPSLPFREKPVAIKTRSETWRKGLASYAETHPLSKDELLAIDALSAANPILAGCNWIRWIYTDRRRFEDPDKILTRFERLTAQLSG